MDADNGPAVPLMKAEAAALARDKGWIAPEQYDYSKYMPAVPDQGVSEATEHGQGPQEVLEWASNAMKYEWSDEYGDVGPENLELEKMLFHSDLITRAGIKFEK
jgi:ATP-dependent RNA helicase DDX3X